MIKKYRINKWELNPEIKELMVGPETEVYRIGGIEKYPWLDYEYFDTKEKAKSVLKKL